MPSRPAAILIVAFWLASLGWLGYREWWPWLRADAPPPFAVELADEAAPQLSHWGVYRGDQRVGTATTRMTLLKDDTLELFSAVENLDITVGALGVSLRVQAPRATTTQRVTRKGELLSVNSNMRLSLSGLGESFEFQTAIAGEVRDGFLHAHGRLTSDSFAAFEEPLDPIRLESGSLLNPLQPIARIPVRPGQRWTVTHVDPLAEALQAAVRQKLKGAGGLLGRMTEPRALLAEVQEQPESLDQNGRVTSCYVINLKSKDITGRTWVRATDGEVLKQEVVGMGERLTLVRED